MAKKDSTLLVLFITSLLLAALLIPFKQHAAEYIYLSVPLVLATTFLLMRKKTPNVYAGTFQESTVDSSSAQDIHKLSKKIRSLSSENQDLGERNQLLNEIIDTKTRRLQIFLEAIDVNIPLSITDAEGTIVQVNDPFCELTKYSESELVGANHNIINSGEHSDEFFSEFWNTISAGKKWKGELCNVAKDGSTYWVDIVVIPFLNGQEEIEQFISLQFSITEARNAQKRQEEYIDSLEQMAFITSHKINKPVANLKGMLKLLESDNLDGAELEVVKSYLKISSEELETCTRELNDFIYKEIKVKSPLSVDAILK